jgi:hypothetical protein
MSLNWTLHKVILAYCTQCGKKRAHQLGHFFGRRGNYRICMKCDFVTEVDDEKAT